MHIAYCCAWKRERTRDRSVGASIKDLGKKIFGFTKLEEKASELLKRLEE